MRRDDIEEGRMAQHARGLGTVTREMVVKRARELALINGRSPTQMLQSDFDQAKRELTGRGEVIEEQEAPRRRSHAELRETIRGTRGRQARTWLRTMNRPMRKSSSKKAYRRPSTIR